MSESDEFTPTADTTEAVEAAPDATPEAPAAEAAPAKKKAPARKKAPAKKAAAKRTQKKAAAAPADELPLDVDEPAAGESVTEEAPAEKPAPAKAKAKAAKAPMVLFQAPEATPAPRRRKPAKKAAAAQEPVEEPTETEDEQVPAAAETEAQPTEETGETGESTESGESAESAESGDSGEGEGEGGRRRRRRGGRRRRKPVGENGEADGNDSDDESGESAEGDDDSAEGDGEGEGTSRRRRTRVRQPRNPEDEITSIGGSTRLEAKKQRRREGREAGRRRAPIVSEAEFLARREAVDRKMVIRQKGDLTQIAVLEDKVLVEHYVARESQTSLIGNIYLGRVQNVLPSMEAAFIDIGKGRNAVLYAGEVNWKALGHKDNQPRKIEAVLSPGQTILVQVSKDPIGHKGARLTGQISLPGRFLVYVPDGTTSGISRKLPDTERNRLKTLLKEIVPDTAGVIVRTAAEGASEDELTQDVERLTARWSDIEGRVKAGKGPELLYGEPDLTLKVVRDLFTEDFGTLVVQGDDAWDLVDGYVAHVAPDLRERLERFEPTDDGKDVFATYRIDEQIAKGLDRKVWLPSGGSLIIDRTEAMTVVDVNTGKFTGSGGNLEETVTKNNLEAAEEIVRQLRLRDIGGIIVVDFIDMVLESNRDLVLRRLVECLGRDRTRHQVAEVTSLGLVQMTRKRIGTGLLEAFAEDCTHCKGRGVVIHDHPIEPTQKASDEPRGRRSRGGRTRGKGEAGGNGNGNGAAASTAPPSPKDLAGTKPHAPEDEIVPIDAELEETQAPEVEEAAAEATQPEVQPETAPETEPETAPEPEVAPEPEPAAPVVKVVTSTRRRSARPAGPPKAETAPEPITLPVADPVVESVAEIAPAEPGEAPTEAPAEPDSEGEHDEHASVVHVPIKKKGTRKR